MQLREPLRISADNLRSSAFSMAAVLVTGGLLSAIVLVGLLALAMPGPGSTHTAEPQTARGTYVGGVMQWVADPSSLQAALLGSNDWPGPDAQASRLIVGVGAAGAAVFALFAALLAARSMQRLHAAQRIAGGVRGEGQISTIALADLIVEVAVTQSLVPRALMAIRAALGIALLTTLFAANAALLGSGPVAVALAALLLLLAGGLVLVAPVVLAAFAVGQLLRRLVQRAAGKTAGTARESLATRWPAVVLDGTWHIDLSAPSFAHAFHPGVHEWMTETLRAARTIHDRLREEKAAKGDANPFKGIASGPLAKWGEKLGIDKVVFDPGRARPRHITPDDVRLKVEKDHTNYVITITSSVGGKFPGETTLDSSGRLTLPEWTRADAMRNS
ncbi:MAG: hypothetical protein AB7K09_10615 [Planctomycetota bacterium]